MTLKLFFIVLGILSQISFQATIIPDITSPMYMIPPQNPTTNTLPQLNLKFSLPTSNAYNLGVNSFFQLERIISIT